MELNKIEQALDAYFEGNSTLEQEQQLRDYFTGTHVAPHLQEYIPFFTALKKAKQERYTGEINLPRRKRYPWMSIAASILVLIGLFLTFNNSNNNNNNNINSKDYGTYDDPEVAARKTRQALFMMGSFIGENTSKLQVLDEFEKSKEKYINKN